MRALLLGPVVMGLVACATTGPATHEPRPPAVRVVGAFELPFFDARVQELSSLAWDDVHRTLLAMSDSTPAVVPFVPSADLGTWSIGAPIPLAVPASWDGEGLAVLPDELLVANERGPHLYVLDRDGGLRTELPIPPRFGARCRRNRCFESLGATPDGRFVYTANECALEGDGPLPTATAGTLVRILELDRRTGGSREVAYRTDPVFAQGAGDMGVVDVTPLAKGDLLVLERSHVEDVGTSVKLYRVQLAGTSDVSGVELLPADTVAVTKRLVVDLGTLPLAHPPRPGSSSRGPLPNYEGLALGPRTQTGEQIIFLVSDNNGRPQQSARLLTIAVPGL